MGVTALQAAKHACDTSDWTLTNLQLQKILYLAHMVYAGRHKRPMIADENFQAWNYGPVLPSVYHRASAFGARPIRNIFRSILCPSDPLAVELIDEAVDRFGNEPAFKLVKLTHDGKSAWSRHFTTGHWGVEIPFSSVLDEYAQRFGPKE
ncbi:MULTISPECIES: Panacea domain-containing protein [Achromobacter]|nr:MULTISPECIES: Panacea domain-containing protein [Achromobacter]